jgi:resuscitation-promoting factor RpfB
MRALLHVRRARRRVRSAVGLLAVGLLALPLVAWSNHVVVEVDGDEHGLRTYAGTVGEVLEQLDVEVGPDDLVQPAKGTEVEDGLEIEIARAITIEVVVDGAVEEVTAPVSTVAGVLEEAGLEDVRDLGARIVPAWTQPVEDGDTVHVAMPTTVTVEVDGDRLRHDTLVSTVGNLLVKRGIELGEHDRVAPPLHAPIDGPIAIVIERVEFAEVVEEVVLERGEVRRETERLVRGTTRVDDEGADGLRLDTYVVELVDGEEVDRELVAEEVVEEPRDRVVLVGTYVPPPPRYEAGDTVWDDLAQCEANGNWAARGFYHGGLQFHPDTWRRNKPAGFPDYAYQASREQQIEVGKRVQARQGWGAWPHCSRVLGLR